MNTSAKFPVLSYLCSSAVVIISVLSQKGFPSVIIAVRETHVGIFVPFSLFEFLILVVKNRISQMQDCFSVESFLKALFIISKCHISDNMPALIIFH